MHHSVQLASPLGELEVVSTDDGLCALYMGAEQGEVARRHPGCRPGDPHGAVAALRSYLAGDLRALEALPVDAVGTPFQQRVWEQLRRIPAGETLSYGELARRVGSVARAVGAANGANPVGIVVPCHRVIGTSGELVGYAGGLDRKRWLLRHEGVSLPGEQAALF